jgi:transcription elongation factor Elf1
MNILNCPHCGKQGISTLRKMFLGPAVPATCKACGKKVGVPYTAMLATIPFLTAILASAFVETVALKAALWIVGAIVMSIIHKRWVPLEPR